jgi:hypothetical protein
VHILEAAARGKSSRVTELFGWDDLPELLRQLHQDRPLVPGELHYPALNEHGLRVDVYGEGDAPSAVENLM